MDVAGRENGSALDGHESDRGPGANRESDSYPDFYSDRQLRHLSGDRQSFPAHSAAEDWNRSLYHRVVVRRYRHDPGMDRCRTKAEHQLATSRVRNSHFGRSDGLNYWP